MIRDRMERQEGEEVSTTQGIGALEELFASALPE